MIFSGVFVPGCLHGSTLGLHCLSCWIDRVQVPAWSRTIRFIYISSGLPSLLHLLGTTNRPQRHRLMPCASLDSPVHRCRFRHLSSIPLSGSSFHSIPFIPSFLHPFLHSIHSISNQDVPFKSIPFIHFPWFLLLESFAIKVIVQDISLAPLMPELRSAVVVCHCSKSSPRWSGSAVPHSQHPAFQHVTSIQRRQPVHVFVGTFAFRSVFLLQNNCPAFGFSGSSLPREFSVSSVRSWLHQPVPKYIPDILRSMFVMFRQLLSDVHVNPREYPFIAISFIQRARPP